MRIVSLVPSLTETLHDLGVGEQVVGVTRFCVHPPTARTTALTVGGTKDPNVPMIISLRPDFVMADEDENRPIDLEAMRQAGLRVHVTRIETVADAMRELVAIGGLVGRGHEAQKVAGEIQEAAATQRSLAALSPPLRCFVPIWKRPPMTMNGRTYMSDLLSIAGGVNVFASAPRKYFEVSFDEIRIQDPEAILLPTEPYRFREADRAEFAQRCDVPLENIRLVDGQAFTWFGTRTRLGLEAIGQAVAALRPAAPQQS